MMTDLQLYEAHVKYWMQKFSSNEWATFFTLDALLDTDADVVPNFSVVS